MISDSNVDGGQKKGGRGGGVWFMTFYRKKILNAA